MDSSQQPPAASPATPAAQASPEQPATITFDDFVKVQLRVATVVECKPHTKGDRLLVLQLDLGNGERRQICAGLRQHYQPEQLVGKQIVVVANLAPRTMLGEVSAGMLLAATDPATGRVIVVSPTEPVAPGSKVS
jgi:methionine--tRNA ligase beta chain